MIKLMKPSGPVLDFMWDDLDWMADQKIDGFSGSIRFDHNGNASLYKVGAEITHNFPALRCEGLAHTVLHVEWAAGPNVFPEREYAATLVAHNGWHYVPNPQCYVIDVYSFGVLIDRLIERDRVVHRILLEQVEWPVEFKVPDYVLGTYGKQDLAMSRRMHVNKWVDQGYEGAVLKNLSSSYVAGYSAEWRKHKPGREIDAWVMGYNPGGGKYEGTVGSLKLYLIDDYFVPRYIGSCSGMTDGQRHQFKERLDAGHHFAVQVTFQRWSTSGGLLHPSFYSLRPDKGPEDCTFAIQKGIDR